MTNISSNQAMYKMKFKTNLYQQFGGGGRGVGFKSLVNLIGFRSPTNIGCLQPSNWKLLINIKIDAYIFFIASVLHSLLSWN